MSRARSLRATSASAATAASFAQQLVRRRRAVEAVGIFLGDEPGRQRALAEARVLHDRREEIDVVADPLDPERVERGDLASAASSRVGAQVTSLAIIGS